ncbi:MAG: M55 family metallopeptidase, partial [Sphingomonas sp.]
MSFGVFIAVGATGVGGVAHQAALSRDGFEFADARRWATAELLAAIDGARAAGAGRIEVGDRIGAFSVLLDELPDDIRVVRGWPRPLGQMEGVQSKGIAAAIMLGQRARALSREGALAETVSGETIREVRIDGTPVGEIELDARVAAAYGIPVVLVAGGAAAAAEARAALGPIVAVETKRDIGYTASATLAPVTAAARIREGAERAVATRADVALLDVTVKRLEVEFVDRPQPELLQLVPGVERTGAYSVTLPATDAIAARRWLTMITAYKPSGV